MDGLHQRAAEEGQPCTAQAVDAAVRYHTHRGHLKSDNRAGIAAGAAHSDSDIAAEHLHTQEL